MSTFGKTTIGATPSANAGGQEWANARTLSEAGTITKLTMYLDNPNAGAQLLTAAIWADSSGVPGALLGQSNPISIAAGTLAGWQDFPLVSSVAVSAGTYWLGIYAGSTANQVRRYSDTGVSGVMKFRNSVAAPTDPFGAASNFTDDVSMYATYTPSASGTSRLSLFPHPGHFLRQKGIR